MRERLSLETGPYNLEKFVFLYLFGLPAAGKNYVGQVLADAFGYTFYDGDRDHIVAKLLGKRLRHGQHPSSEEKSSQIRHQPKPGQSLEAAGDIAVDPTTHALYVANGAAGTVSVIAPR